MTASILFFLGLDFFPSILNALRYFFRKINLAKVYLFKVNNRTSRKRCEICSRLTIKAPDTFIGNFQYMSHVFLVFPLLDLNKRRK